MKAIEFMGMPKAGKTTQLEIAETILKHEKNLKVRTIYEGARVCPLDKKDRFNYNAWSFHSTMNRLLEARHSDCDFLLIDRGVYDHVAFTLALYNRGEITRRQYEAQTLYFHEFSPLEDAVLMFMVKPEEAMERENKYYGTNGRVMNAGFLSVLESAYRGTASLIQPEHLIIDSSQTPEQNTKEIMNFIL